MLYRATNAWDRADEGIYWSDRNPENITYVIDALNVDNYLINSIVDSNAASEPFFIAMPEESVNYSIVARGGKIWAIVDGSYTMHLTGDLMGCQWSTQLRRT